MTRADKTYLIRTDGECLHVAWLRKNEHNAIHLQNIMSKHDIMYHYYSKITNNQNMSCYIEICWYSLFSQYYSHRQCGSKNCVNFVFAITLTIVISWLQSEKIYAQMYKKITCHTLTAVTLSVKT